MIDELRSCSKTKNTRILVITPPPIYTPLLREKGPRNGEDRHYDITSSYALGVLDVMRELTMETEHIQSLDFHATIEAATDDYCAIFYEEDVPGHAIERIQTAMDDIFTDGLHLGKRVPVPSEIWRARNTVMLIYLYRSRAIVFYLKLCSTRFETNGRR